MDNKICDIHNQPVLFCESAKQQNKLLFCRFCVQQRNQTQNIEDVDYEQQQALEQLESQCDQIIGQFKVFAEKLELQYQIIEQKLKKIKQQVEHNLSNIISKKNQIKNIDKGNISFQQNYIIEQEILLKNQLAEIKQQLNIQLKDIEISFNLDQLYLSLDSISMDENNKVKEDYDDKKITLVDKKFNYQLIEQSTYKQKEWCCAIAFNQDGSIMIAGCGNLIKVFEFKDEKLKKVQELKGHLENILCLKFLRTSNYFISTSADSTIIIWGYNLNNQWQINQVLTGHTSRIWCITINQDEDLLISGSMDKSIKFWNKSDNTWNSNQSITCQSQVFSISLSNQEDRLIAIVENKQILVIKLEATQWMISQKISVEQHGYRLCYINQDQFLFQPSVGNHLQIFDYDPKDQTYKKGQELYYLNQQQDFYCLFPIYYNSEIGLIMVKHGVNVHIIRRSQNGSFTVEQSIKFNINYLFGGITNDGKYIATWDDNSKEIQIRRLGY